MSFPAFPPPDTSAKRLAEIRSRHALSLERGYWDDEIRDLLAMEAKPPSEGEHLIVQAALAWFRAHSEPAARREWTEADHRLMAVLARAVLATGAGEKDG